MNSNKKRYKKMKISKTQRQDRRKGDSRMDK